MDLYVKVAAVTLLALLFETGIILCKVWGNLLSNWYFHQVRIDEHDWHVDDIKKASGPFEDILSYEVWIDWCKTPSLHETINSRHCYFRHGQTFALHMEDVQHNGQQVALGLEMKTFCGGRSFALWTSTALIYTACLYVMFFALGWFHLPWCVMPSHHLSGTGTQNVT